MEADLFTSDSFKKQVLESEGISVSNDSENSGIQVFGDDLSEFQDMIQSTPKIPGGVKNIIQDASILSRNDKE